MNGHDEERDGRGDHPIDMSSATDDGDDTGTGEDRTVHINDASDTDDTNDTSHTNGTTDDGGAAAMSVTSTNGTARSTGSTEGDGHTPGSSRTSTDLAVFHETLSCLNDGDLSARFPEESADEELAALAASFNAFVSDIVETLQEVDGFNDEVSGAAKHVRSTVVESKARSGDVYESVDDIAANAADQREEVAETVGELQRVSAATEEVAASAEQVATTASGVADRAADGNDSATAALDELEVIDERTETALDRVETLETEVAAIEDVTDLIREIADETNILALNASIEAARAGAAGAGFEVVAEEVKNLAEEAREATGEIEASIESVRTETDATVAEITEMRERVGEGIATAEDALGAFTELTEDVEETTVGIREISSATDDQAIAVEEAVRTVESVGDVAEATATRAAEVTTIAHTQRTSLTEVVAGAAALEDRTGTVEDRLDDYRLADSTGTSEDATVLEFWHALSGSKARLLETFIDEFESTVGDVSIRASSKGSYRGVFNATLAAAERGDPPAIAQIYEIGTKRALDSGAFTPVQRHLDPERFDPDELLDPVADYYRTEGRLHSMPFNSSTPLLYYNRDAFERAGLDPADPPSTFREVRAAAERIVESGVADVGITFANYSWFIEQWFSEAGQPLVDARNGRAGTPTEAYFDSPAGTTVFEWITAMEADGLYHDPGIEARGAAREAFHDGTAAMLIGSTSSMSGVYEGASFPVETGYFPVADERHGVVIGGGSLWIAADLPTRTQRVAAEFLAWLAAPERQARWHRETGYFPVHEDALDRLEAEGWFTEHPGARTAIDQLLAAEDGVATTGARIGPFDTVRTLVAEAAIDAREHGVEEALTRLNEGVEMKLDAYAREIE
ncbi:methyl-accepting chemotaxis protein [Halorubrum vacuolatum]|uniref:sn-glycerol 3-phosphate transport system substrate-binding protein n=1 Tax=Halorubrum vacuolatum TaxID=63740 RepID=A0A238WBI4_HALVU|nr:extracellular solute-binding protein [Halorubrum vacuolatum]SNR43777.1 sn-glycerol 3-phosphate transport system substrate-binding protein [Halorubrum vacuolatum]